MFFANKNYLKGKVPLFKIHYHLYSRSTSWSASLHQLNSDVLKRHVLPQLNTDDLDLHFSFCEVSESGQFQNSDGVVLGSFHIESDKD